MRGIVAVGVGGAMLAFATASSTQSETKRPLIEPADSNIVYPDQQMPPTPDPGMDNFWQPPILPNHPPIDQIPPMPMPEVVDVPTRLEDSNPVIHDAETGETWNLPLVQNAIDGSGVGGEQYIGADGRAEFTEDTALGFGTMFAVGPATTFPRRANVKLIMRFVDQGGTNRFFACSGCMLDAGVVATAGHCVYARSPNGINIFDWAAEIWVYPGWDGVSNGSIFNPPGSNEVIQHWGWARGTSYGAWTGWTENGDFNWDWGLIRLNRFTTGSRSVGALTGNFAWAYGGSCGFSQTTTYNNYSFPAESCHNGRDMYFWAGTYDTCVDSNRLEINTGGQCLNSVWGGMSGSGAYYVDTNDVRRIHTVCSYRQSGANPQYGGYVRMWEAFHNFLVDFRADTRTNTFDIEAMQYRISGSLTVPAGQSMAGGTAIIANATNASSPTGTRTLRVYLSTDNVINSSDTLLATWNYTVDFNPMQVRTFNVPGPTIPLSVAPGNYWVGVILDSGSDSNPANNATSLWDAQPITVLGDPDSCVGNCGGQAPGGCWCDSGCVGFGDCCFNACQVCGHCYTGACCLGDGSCTQVTQANCTSLGGNYHGDQTTCESINCPQPPALCHADFNSDNTVDVSDLLILLGAWGQCGNCGNCPSDLTGDCAVDVSDLLVLLGSWGQCGCGTPFSCGGPINWCDAAETCFCAGFFDGSTGCVDASTLCGGACPDGNCPPGFICLANSCCGPTNCVPIASLCD